MHLTTIPPRARPPVDLRRFKPPVMGVCADPVRGMRQSDMHEVPVGVRLRDFIIECRGGALVCRLNGDWLLREDWDWKTAPGDVVEWFVFPQGREAVRLLLQVAALVISFYFPAAAPYLAAALAAYNLLVPPRGPKSNDEQPGSIYSTGLGGNAARLDQPIWRNCGQVKITPPFAALPYYIYQPSDPANPTVDCDQYYYAIFAIGIGEYDLIRASIAKTPVASFADVLVAAYLAPGVQPSLARANVVTSSEVTGLEMTPDLYVGAFVVCRPGDSATHIGIDISAPQGLGRVQADGDTQPVFVSWRVEAQAINDFGVPSGEWAIIGTESRNMDTNTAQRWSFEYELAAPIRCQVRVVRTNVKNTHSNARDQIQWDALRCRLLKEASLNQYTAHFEIVMRASKQLSVAAQQDFSLLVAGKCPTWSPDGGWTAAVTTRNPAWWLADLWRDPVWGEGLPDERIDLQGLYDWAQTLDARQDHFDYAFTSSVDSWDAAQLIARAGRARASTALGVRTIARDELVTLPLTAFSARNTEPDSIAESVAGATRETPDAVVVTFQSNRTWDLQEVWCVVPGTASEPVNPVFLHLDGVTGPIHAEREGRYMAAKVAYRTTSYAASVEMEGFLQRFLDTVLLQQDLVEAGQTGDVAEWDVDSLTMRLTEAVDFSTTPVYLILRRDDGSLTEAAEVTPGPDAMSVRLPAAPDFDIKAGTASRERPVFFAGPAAAIETCKIDGIRDGGKNDDGAQLFDLTLVLDDPRVHAADVDLLPGPGEVQDPIDDGSYVDDGGGGGTVAVIARMHDHLLTFPGGAPSYVWVTFKTDGRLYWQRSIFDNGYYDGEWLNQVVEPSVAAAYQIKGHGVDEDSHPNSSDLGTWMSVSSDLTFRVLMDLGTVVFLGIQIRRAESPTVLVQRKILFSGSGKFSYLLSED